VVHQCGRISEDEVVGLAGYFRLLTQVERCPTTAAEEARRIRARARMAGGDLVVASGCGCERNAITLRTLFTRTHDLARYECMLSKLCEASWTLQFLIARRGTQSGSCTRTFFVREPPSGQNCAKGR
jgi:hypothetical protein